MIEEIVGFANKLESIALIGAGGIGKTSIALTVLHDERIKNRFGDNRRFIRCDKFSASRTNFLAQLSNVIGAGIKNLDDLAPLKPHLSSKEIIIFLDNAESILDPQGIDAQGIYTTVKELSHFSNICLGITSRMSTVPPHCKRLEIPTLSMEAACDIFYGIYNCGGRSAIISDLVRRLDFHALSITLLATTASHHMWDYNRLVREWAAHRAQVLRTDYNESLAATIELSLASPTFQKLGSDARELLRVIAFFPQGIDENNFDWLFPAISYGEEVLDKFCSLSLTSRSSGFITMLAPIRDYLCPQDPKSYPPLCVIKDRYFTRLSVDIYPDKPVFAETQWIVSEDANVEHLLDVFTSIDDNSGEVWEACSHFMEHLHWHKPRLTVLGSKVEGLPDDHLFKPKCLLRLSELFERVANHMEEKRLLTHTLQLERQRGDDFRVAHTLDLLSGANRMVGCCEEGIQHAEEALGIYEQLGDRIGQANSLTTLAWVLFDDNQVDAAQDVASRAINLVPEQNKEFLVYLTHQILGIIYWSKGKTKKAVYHLETSLEIAYSVNRRDHLFGIHDCLARVFFDQGKFVEATAQVKQGKPHAADHSRDMAHAMLLQGRIWYKQRRLEDAKSEVLGALEIYEKFGVEGEEECCQYLLQKIERAMKSRSTTFRR